MTGRIPNDLRLHLPSSDFPPRPFGLADRLRRSSQKIKGFWGRCTCCFPKKPSSHPSMRRPGISPNDSSISPSTEEPAPLHPSLPPSGIGDRIRRVFSRIRISCTGCACCYPKKSSRRPSAQTSSTPPCEVQKFSPILKENPLREEDFFSDRHPFDLAPRIFSRHLSLSSYRCILEDLMEAYMINAQRRATKATVHVLIVEDTLTVQHMLAHKISLLHQTYACATNNAETIVALHASKMNPFDVIIMDYNLPDKNGTETTHEIRTLVGFSPIIISHSSHNFLLQNARAEGYDDVLSKSKYSDLDSLLRKYFPSIEFPRHRLEIAEIKPSF